MMYTLPSMKLTMDGWKTSFLLGWLLGRCYVSFSEGICSYPNWAAIWRKSHQHRSGMIRSGMMMMPGGIIGTPLMGGPARRLRWMIDGSTMTQQISLGQWFIPIKKILDVGCCFFL